MEQSDKNIAKWIVIGVLAFIALIILLSTVGVVDAGERGVRVKLGNVTGVIDSGIYFKTPFIESVRKIDIRTQSIVYERENPLAAASSDLQNVDVASVTNYHIDPSKVGEVYVRYKDLENFEEKVIRPAVRDTVKTEASKFTASELVTKRELFAEAVASKLNERFVDNFVVFEQSNITNLEYSKSFSDAIEAKVTAQQNAEAAKNKLEQVKFEAQQTIETAKATAEAQRISSAALAAQGGEDYVALKWIEQWDGHLPQQYVPGTALPFLNLKP